MKKEKLEQTLQDDEQHAQYMQKVEKWQTFKNQTEGGKMRNFKLKAKTTVTVRNSTYFEAKKFLGILWPVALYIKHFGKKPKRSDIGSYVPGEWAADQRCPSASFCRRAPWNLRDPHRERAGRGLAGGGGKHG